MSACPLDTSRGFIYIPPPMATPTSSPHPPFNILPAPPISPNTTTLPIFTTSAAGVLPRRLSPSISAASATPKLIQTDSSDALPSSLRRCSAALSLRDGCAIHAQPLRLGLLPGHPRLAAHQLRLYASSGLHDSAGAAVSSVAPRPRSPFLYNSLIRSHTYSSLHDSALDLFLEMLLSGARPNEFTFPFVLKSCAILGLIDLGRQIHALILKTGLFLTNVFCASALLDLYSKLASLDHACQLFDRIPDRNVVTWNSMISAYTQNGFWEKGLELLDLMEEAGFEAGASSWNSVVAGCVRFGDAELALDMFCKMLSSGNVKPNSATFNTLLPVIPSILSLYRIKELHGFAIRNLEVVNLDPIDDDRLRSAIANGYAIHGCMVYASRLFGRIKLKTCRLCNSMISGFLAHGKIYEAFSVFRTMAFQYVGEAQILSKVSLTLLLPECSRASKAGPEIHAYAYRRGLESNTSVSNALMAMYARKGDRGSADRVFQRSPEKDVVSWNTMVSSYALIHDFDRAFELFRGMIAEGVRPDEYSLSSVLNGCGFSSYLRQGMTIHGHMIKSGYCESYPVVQNALVDTYGKCGCVEDAKKVFDEMDSRDNITWNTIISSYGVSGHPHEAFSLFDKMRKEGWKPNRVTFIAILSACSHAGLLDEGLHYFDSMTKEHGIVPDVDHYACVVDNLGRVGQLDRAYQFIKDMPIEPDDCIWGALLNSCRIHGNIELAEVAAKHLIELEPQHSGYWVLLSNIYADASRWNDVAYVRQAMKDGGVKKCPGYSWIEVGGSELHRFLTTDKSHKKCADIYLALDGLTDQLKDEGYVPLIDSFDQVTNEKT